MDEYIWNENGKYFKSLSDLTGRIIFQQEISKQEYLDILTEIIRNN